MGIFGRLFGSRRRAHTVTSTADVRPIPSAEETRYRNYEWNFGLIVPKSWEVIFENKMIQDLDLTQPVRIAGPRTTASRPCITVITGIVKNSREGPRGYMAKTSANLRDTFADFRLLTQDERILLGWPAAWMTYTYSTDSGPRKDLNVTAFVGTQPKLLFQFVCETAEPQASDDIPVFERIIETWEVDKYGLSYPLVSPMKVASCHYCGEPFSSGETPYAMLNLESHRLIGVCEICRRGSDDLLARQRRLEYWKANAGRKGPA